MIRIRGNALPSGETVDARDPRTDLSVLEEPVAVILRGRRMR